MQWCYSKEGTQSRAHLVMDTQCWSCDRPVDHIQQCCQQSTAAMSHGWHCCCMIADSTVAWSKALSHDKQPCWMINSTIAWLNSLKALLHDWKRYCMIRSAFTWLLTALLHDWQCCHLINSAVAWLMIALLYEWQPCHMICITYTWINELLIMCLLLEHLKILNSRRRWEVIKCVLSPYH
jgi:hypothetical protein